MYKCKENNECKNKCGDEYYDSSNDLKKRKSKMCRYSNRFRKYKYRYTIILSNIYNERKFRQRIYVN